MLHKRQLMDDGLQSLNRTFETACLAETAGTIAFSLRYSRRRTAAWRYLRVTFSAARDLDELPAEEDGSRPAALTVRRGGRRKAASPPHW